MPKKYFYPVIFDPEEVGVSVYVPDIPGCNTQGDSLEEALEMVQEVIGLMLEGKKPEEYPQASKPNEINLEGNQFVMMVAFDKLAYDKKYNAKAVKKTLSIPAWLNNLAIDNDINFSNLLLRALINELVGIARLFLEANYAAGSEKNLLSRRLFVCLTAP